MCSTKLNTLKGIVVCVLIQSTALAFPEPLIINYDNNPNLQKAMEYDLTMDNKMFVKLDGSIDTELWQSYVSKASRELAEKYYLAYLEEVKEPFQRVRVYAKLSTLYAGGVNQEVGPRPTAEDRAKALEYARKGLAEAPEAVGFATLQLRGLLTMLPDREQAFRALEDHYEWLLSIDEQKIIDNWLPLRPGEDKPNSSFVDDLLELAPGLADTQASNLVSMAVGLGRRKMQRAGSYGKEYDPCYLPEIIERFPGTRAHELAKLELAKQADTVADEHLKQLSSTGKGSEIASTQPEVPNDTSGPKEKEAEDELHTPIASAANSNDAGRSSSTPYIIVGAILALTITTLVAVKRFRGVRKHR